MKAEVDENHVITISGGNDEKDTLEGNITVQSDDTLKDVIWYKWTRDTNDTIEPEKITRSGRVSRRPKGYEDYEHF